jgi:hypothetical protein
MRRAITVAFYLAFAVFTIWYVRQLDLTSLSEITIRYGELAIATGLALLFRYCGVLIWLQVLSGLGVTTGSGKVDLAYVYAKSWLGRYLPGKVTWIFGKIYFASEHGISKRKLAVGSVFEAALQTFVTLFLSLLLLSVDIRLDVFSPGQKAAMLLASAALLATMMPAVFNRVMALTIWTTGRQPLAPDDRVGYRTLLRGFTLYAVGFFLSGASYFFFTRAIDSSVGFEHFAFLVGVFNLAGAIGILSLFAPSGLGVREGIQLLLLPLVIPAEIALVVTVAARIWSIAVDGLFVLIAWLHRRLRGRVPSGQGSALRPDHR